MKKIILVTGGFDPLHSGHIAYFNAAKALGDQLVVGINSDAWLIRKKGRAFMPFTVTEVPKTPVMMLNASIQTILLCLPMAGTELLKTFRKCQYQALCLVLG